MTYSMIPLKVGTRLRVNHSAFDTVMSSYGPADKMEGDELWIAPANGAEVNAGDKWLHVTKVNSLPLAKPGWMAYIHKGVPICGSFTDSSVVTPQPAGNFPEYFDLTDPSGLVARYNFVKIL